jgi:hypothetical protein
MDGSVRIEKALAEPADLNLCIFRSRRRTTWWEFSARLFARSPPLVRTGQSKMPKRESVRAQLVGRQGSRRETQFPEQLAHQPKCRALVAAALHQHIENLALVIDGAPQVHPLAGDANHHLVEVRSIARVWAAPSQLSSDPGPEFQNPAPHRFIGNLQAALDEEFLNVAVAQGETGDTARSRVG